MKVELRSWLTFDEWREANYCTEWNEREYARAAWYAAIAMEREECARTAEDEAMQWASGRTSQDFKKCADAIRARKDLIEWQCL